MDGSDEPVKILDAMLAYSDNEALGAAIIREFDAVVSRYSPRGAGGRHHRSGDSVQRQLNQRLFASAGMVSPNRRAQL